MPMLRSLAAVAVAMAMASGCGGGEAAPGSAKSTSLTDEQRTALAKARRDSLDKNAVANYRRNHSQFLIDCMRRAGFSDFRLPPGFSGGGSSTAPREPVPAQDGFGLSTRIEEMFGGQDDAADGTVDPYYASLSPARRTAYDGSFADCQRKARQELGPPPGMVTVRGDLSGVQEEAERRAAADPRLASATKTWSSCMAREGFQAATRKELMAGLEQRARPFWELYRSAKAQASRGTRVRLADVLDERQQAELTKLQQYERQVAVADDRCGGRQLGRLRDQLVDEHLRKLEEGG